MLLLQAFRLGHKGLVPYALYKAVSHRVASDLLHVSALVVEKAVRVSGPGDDLNFDTVVDRLSGRGPLNAGELLLSPGLNRPRLATSHN